MTSVAISTETTGLKVVNIIQQAPTRGRRDQRRSRLPDARAPPSKPAKLVRRQERVHFSDLETGPDSVSSYGFIFDAPGTAMIYVRTKITNI
jgi:hypothetical protein